MRRIACTLLTLAIVIGGVPLIAQPPETDRFSQKEKADLQETLATGLKVRTKAEREFINKVVKKVNDKELSEALVKALYTRARSQYSRYPLPYFTAMLKQLAKKEGVTL